MRIASAPGVPPGSRVVATDTPLVVSGNLQQWSAPVKFIYTPVPTVSFLAPYFQGRLFDAAVEARLNHTDPGVAFREELAPLVFVICATVDVDGVGCGCVLIVVVESC